MIDEIDELELMDLMCGDGYPRTDTTEENAKLQEAIKALKEKQDEA